MKFLWKIFRKIGPAHAPEIEFCKKMEGFSKNRSVPRPGKLKFRKKF